MRIRGRGERKTHFSKGVIEERPPPVISLVIVKAVSQRVLSTRWWWVGGRREARRLQSQFEGFKCARSVICLAEFLLAWVEPQDRSGASKGASPYPVLDDGITATKARDVKVSR